MSRKIFRSGAAPSGVELDRKMREILLAATPETALDATSKLVALGFGPRSSFELVAKTLEAKGKRDA